MQLDPDRPTGLVMFGGHGSKVMRSIAKRLQDTQLILICGHNSALADELRTLKAAAPRVVIGVTAQMRYFMQLSQFFIGKPGPGSISEAIQQRLPVIVVRNAWTMPQERYNTEWVQEHGAGIVLDSFRAVREGVAELTGRLDEFRARVAQIQNRAIFEIPAVLESILRASDAASLRASDAASDRRLFHPAFPGRPTLAFDRVSNRAAVERSATGPQPTGAAGSATRRRARRHRRA